MVDAAVRVDRPVLGPRQAAVVGVSHLDVPLLVAVVLPDGVQVAVVRIHADPRIVVRADEVARDTEAAEVARGGTRQDVVSDQHRRRTVQVRCEAGPGRVAVNGKLLVVEARCVAVVEQDLQVTVRQHDRVRALVEVARMCVVGGIEEVPEVAEVRIDSADLFGR